jgi:hypothetical protein
MLGVAAGLASVAMMITAPAVLAATIKLGQTKQNYFCSAQYQWIQTAAHGLSYSAPANGKLTKWSTLAGPNAGTMQFEVWHPAGSNNFTLVYISQPTNLTANTLTTVKLVPNVVVKAGDLLGYRSVTMANCALNTGNAADTYVYNTSGVVPTVGQTVLFAGGVSGFQFDISAILR